MCRGLSVGNLRRDFTNDVEISDVYDSDGLIERNRRVDNNLIILHIYSTPPISVNTVDTADLSERRNTTHRPVRRIN